VQNPRVESVVGCQVCDIDGGHDGAVMSKNAANVRCAELS